MCSIFQIQIQINPLKFITDTLKALSGPIGYLRDPEHRITQLIDAMNHLQAKSEDGRNRIRHAEHAGEVPTHEADYWLTKVEDFIAQIMKIVDGHKKGSFRWVINRRAAHILVEIKEFRENFVLDVLTAKIPPKGVQEVPAIVANATMDTYLSKLKSALEDDESRIIGIWGMGGVGKTTLLSSLNKKLYDSSEAGESQQNFDYVIWAVGSRDYKLEKLQSDIAKRLGLPLCEDTVDQAMKIMDFLKNKSFLLLLDDLWQPVDFAELGIPDPTRRGFTKQKVVFTTRLENVCGNMQARPKIKIECLDEEGAWLLFKEKVGEETLQANPRILSLAQQVARECDGLPLALVVIGSAMSTKKTPMEWQDAINQLKKSSPHEIHGMDNKIFSNLKFSYDNLDNEVLRKCFVLCSLWPEDHSISKLDLIECWMGHDLINERKFDNINEAYDRGYSLIGALEAACLLEPVDYDEEIDVKMHDVVRDLALSIGSDCGKKPRRFIVLSSDTSFFPANCSELETLIVNRRMTFISFAPRFFEGIRGLTYLDLSNTKVLHVPEEISLLCNLQYLNLSSTFIKFLPHELVNLHKLRFLLLRNIYKSIFISSGLLEKLEMLSVIDMSNTKCINPQELSMFCGNLKGLGIMLERIEDLHQLAKLPNVLIWRLVLKDLEELNEPLQLLSPLKLGSRNIRSSIQILKIEYSDSFEVVSMKSDRHDNIQNWCMSRLEELELKCLPKLHDFVWQRVCPVKMLPSLTVLTIDGCHNLSNISWVILLPSLEYLTVSHCNDVQQIIGDYNEFAGSNDKENDVGIVGRAFPSLRRLTLLGLRSLLVFGGAYAFPSLDSLTVIQCSKMKTLPFGTKIAGKNPKNICCQRKWWEDLTMEDTMRAMLLPNFTTYAQDIKRRRRRRKI